MIILRQKVINTKNLSLPNYFAIVICALEIIYILCICMVPLCISSQLSSVVWHL